LTTQRLEAFSDSVFAVAITLLAFELRPPELGAITSDRKLYEAFLALAPQVYSYAVTFVLVGMYWIAHHHIYGLIRYVDRPLQWMNVFHLLWVCLLPASATTMGRYPALRIASVAYGLNLLLIWLTLLAMWRYAIHKGLVAPDTDPELTKILTRRIAFGGALYGVGIAASVLEPRAGTIVYMLTLLVYMTPSRIDRHLATSRTSRE
jgi:uncharacterized membrane protein